MKVSYSWLQEYIDTPLPPVQDVVTALTMHSFEIEDTEEKDGDIILDVKILPNRAHDCLSHYGIASEIASVCGLSLKKNLESVKIPELKGFKVNVKEKDLCKRMFAILIKDVTVSESPDWLKSRLQSMGQRPISNIVDITNYITLALGQPMHAFDADTIKGNEIYIRKAKSDEKVTLLNDKEYVLTSNMLVIADKEGPLDVAGIMGGKHSATYEKTKNILLVVDNFDPVSIRKTAKSLGLRTDASVRFENEISSSLVDVALGTTLKLISELAGGNVFGGTDVYPKPQKQTVIHVTAEEISTILGVNLNKEKIIELLTRQNISVHEENDKLLVHPPLVRLDIVLKQDVTEEVGRLYGYEKIEPKALTTVVPVEVNNIQYISSLIRNAFVKEGFSEIYTYAFVDEGQVEIENPLAGDKKFLRQDLSSAMSRSLELNFKFLDLLGTSSVKLFEIGKVFTKNGEYLHLSLGVKYPKGKLNADEEISRVINVLKQALSLSFNNISVVGGIAEIDLGLIVEQVDGKKEYSPDLWIDSAQNINYKPISVYPFAVRDVAVFVPNSVSSENVRDLISAHLTPLVVRFSLFDTFVKNDPNAPHGQSKTSYAFRLVFQSQEKTLTDEEINEVMNPIYETLKGQEGFEIR